MVISKCRVDWNKAAGILHGQHEYVGLFADWHIHSFYIIKLHKWKGFIQLVFAII